MIKNQNFLVKAAGVLLATTPIIIGLYEYHANNQREFRANFLKQQNETYEQLIDQAGAISCAVKDPSKITDFQQADENFEKVYFGRLNLYENLDVEQECDSLYDVIGRFKDIFIYAKPDSLQETKRDDYVDSIQTIVYDLAQNCKQSLKETYKIKDRIK